MVVGAAQLLFRAGGAGASFRKVVGCTVTPRGSIYHRFRRLLVDSPGATGCAVLRSGHS